MTSFEWPSWWSEVCEQVDIVAYEDTALHDQVTEGALCVCSEEVWRIILEKDDSSIRELSESEANEKGRAWRPQIQQITDSEAVLGVVEKIRRDLPLSERELNVLNPESDVPGVGLSRVFDINSIARKHQDVFGGRRDEA